MSNYRSKNTTEVQAQQIDAGGEVRAVQMAHALPTKTDVAGPSLSDIEQMPDVAEMLLKVRGLKTRERWAEICAKPDRASEQETRLIKFVWRAMPGECCQMDAIRLIARAEGRA